MYSVLDVADDILKIAKARGDELTPLQLMKLVYIAHGFYLAMRSGDLFGDRIEAWKYGPVMPDLYQATKKFGRKKIPLTLVDDSPSGVGVDDHKFLKDVYEEYGHLDGISLSSLTHKQGTPWSKIFDGSMGAEIPDSLIKDHYKKIVDGYNTASSTR